MDDASDCTWLLISKKRNGEITQLHPLQALSEDPKNSCRIKILACFQQASGTIRTTYQTSSYHLHPLTSIYIRINRWNALKCQTFVAHTLRSTSPHLRSSRCRAHAPDVAGCSGWTDPGHQETWAWDNSKTWGWIHLGLDPPGLGYNICIYIYINHVTNLAILTTIWRFYQHFHVIFTKQLGSFYIPCLGVYPTINLNWGFP